MSHTSQSRRQGSSAHDAGLTGVRAIALRRWRVASVLTAAMVLVYFGFIALVGFDPALLARPVGTGLSLGIVMGALVIVAAWLLTWVYVSWTNRVYDPAVAALRASAPRDSGGGAQS